MGSVWLPVSGQQSTFVARTDYVRVELIVSDKSGRPVSDLRPEDLEFLDAGRKQEIVDFQFVSHDQTRRSATANVGLVPDVASNVTSAHARAVVIIVDDLHLLPQNLVRTKSV